MMWDTETGRYVPSAHTWRVDSEELTTDDGSPDPWLSRAGGGFRLGAAFHFPGFNFPKGTGTVDGRFSYRPTPYFLHHVQDPYNSWNVTASTEVTPGPMTYWDWLPGVLIIDEFSRYTLPNEALSAFAGTEWADNDRRVFHGLIDDTQYAEHLRAFLRVVNSITGPGWANWPFGHRQLQHAVMCWIEPGARLPDLLLLLGIRQSGSKFSYWRNELYKPGDNLGAWSMQPATWDCRQAMRFVYQAKLLAVDGLPELAVVSAIAALEQASVEILSYRSGGDAALVEKEFKRCVFLSRFDTVLPAYGIVLPIHLFDVLRKAYQTRNRVAHALTPVDPTEATVHIGAIEDVLAWYLANV